MFINHVVFSLKEIIYIYTAIFIIVLQNGSITCTKAQKDAQIDVQKNNYVAEAL